MATGPGDELEAAGRGHLRASHADRERVIGALNAAFVHGRLDRDEFDVRVGRTLASRTYGDLAALTADIPTRLTGPPEAEPAKGSANTKKKAVVALACATPAIPGLLVALPPIPDKSPVAVLVIALICVWGMTVPTGWFLLLLGVGGGASSAPDPQVVGRAPRAGLLADPGQHRAPILI